MSTITLESVKTEQSKLAQRIAQLEKDIKKNPGFFEHRDKHIPLFSVHPQPWSTMRPWRWHP